MIEVVFNPPHHPSFHSLSQISQRLLELLPFYKQFIELASPDTYGLW